jgi:DNA-binding transcriptional MerR regulator
MSKSSKGEGTKIAQAAKDLGVTSVTIRRYISEFNVETTSDENGIKVLPPRAMEEMHEIRRLKEDGLTNPQVLEQLEEGRAKADKPEAKKPLAKRAEKKEAGEPAKKEARKAERKSSRQEEEQDEEEEEAEPEVVAAEVVEEAAEEEAPAAKPEGGEEQPTGELADNRSKHTLTCQTCGKTFEHMNPRLRDCLECYRTKRKERRRDKQKNVIQHPLAAQVANKQHQRQSDVTNGDVAIDVSPTPAPQTVASPLPMSAKRVNPLAGTHKTVVRNYRKAIEETRQITANLKRRLERPDLPENERRWLEQIYAYQLILHQGWRHLSEYKSGTPAGSGSRPET